MEEIGGLALIWLIHAGIAGFLTAPIVFFGRRRVHWRVWEVVVFIAPFIIWCALMFSGLEAGRKSLSNLGEPFYFALAIPVAAAVRVIIGNRGSQRLVAGVLVVIVCLVAVATFFIVPPLPE